MIELCGALKVSSGPLCRYWRMSLVWLKLLPVFLVCSFSVNLFMLENHFKSIGSAAMFDLKLCQLVAM